MAICDSRKYGYGTHEGGVRQKPQLRIAPSGSHKVAARCPGVPKWLLRWSAALALRKSKGARCKIISKAS